MDKKFYWDNGKVKKEGRVTKGKAEGLWTYYYESGEKQSETIFKGDVPHGHTVHFWANGKKKGEGDYVEGELSGRWTAWYANGNKEREGELQGGKEDGQWHLWDSIGHLIGEYEYVEGRLDGWTILYDSTGRKEKRYYANGDLKSYTKYTPEGDVTDSEVLMTADELPPFRREYIRLLGDQSILNAKVNYPFEIDIPGVPYMSATVAVTNATLRKGTGAKFILIPDGKGETCVQLYIRLSNGETVPYGPGCFVVLPK